jgi:hypothetical protein
MAGLQPSKLSQIKAGSDYAKLQGEDLSGRDMEREAEGR